MKKLLLPLIALLLQITAHAQIITTVAGGGTNDPGDGGAATDCLLETPTGVAVDAAGNIYVCERDMQRVRKIAADGTITTFGAMALWAMAETVTLPPLQNFISRIVW